MKCPSCGHDLHWKDFWNLSLSFVCPNCKKRIVFNPAWYMVVAIFFVSFILWQYIPALDSILLDLLLCTVVAGVVGFGGLMVVLYLGAGQLTALADPAIKPKK